MIHTQFSQVRNILALGAHADDIEIGCGGTLLRLLEDNPGTQVLWVTFSASTERAKEAVASAEQFLKDAADSRVIVKSFRDSYFPYCGEELKDFFFDLRQQFTPDLVLTHRREDLHQDHRTIAELTWNTFRDHLILEYEIPKYEGDLGAPNLFVPLSQAVCELKVRGIVDGFESQHSKPWFSADTFWALLRLRGLESGSASQYAEGLYCRKMVV